MLINFLLSIQISSLYNFLYRVHIEKEAVILESLKGKVLLSLQNVL